jgi:hypothetical protein
LDSIPSSPFASSFTEALEPASRGPILSKNLGSVLGGRSNTLPKYYANLYKHHLAVIETTIEPMLRALTTQLRTDKQVDKQLKQIVESLEKMTTAQKGETTLPGSEVRLED